MHGVPGVDEEPREPGRPVVDELVGDAAVRVLGLVRQLVVVVLLVAEGAQEVADRLAVVAAVLAEVLPHPLVEGVVPVAADDVGLATLQRDDDRAVKVLFVHAIGDILKKQSIFALLFAIKSKLLNQFIFT